MAVAFEAAAPTVLSNRSVATAVIASTLGWSLDFFDLLILLYVAPAVGKAFFPLDSPTLSVAAVYASFAAPLLFLLLRLLQGVFVGGVVASTHTIGTESVPPRWRGLMSGLINGGGVGLGAFFAS